MEYCFSYYTKRPEEKKVKFPWWLRWWKKGYFVVKWNWIRCHTVIDCPEGVEEKDFFNMCSSFVTTDPLWGLQVEEAGNIGLHRNYVQTIGPAGTDTISSLTED